MLLGSRVSSYNNKQSVSQSVSKGFGESQRQFCSQTARWQAAWASKGKTSFLKSFGLDLGLDWSFIKLVGELNQINQSNNHLISPSKVDVTYLRVPSHSKPSWRHALAHSCKGRVQAEHKKWSPVSKIQCPASTDPRLLGVLQHHSLILT